MKSLVLLLPWVEREIVTPLLASKHPSKTPEKQGVDNSNTASVRLGGSAAVIVALLLSVCGLGLASCGTNAPTKAAQGEAILITTVNAAVSQWVGYVNAGKATQKQIDLFHKLYDGYYAAQQLAKAVIEKSLAKDPTVTQADIDAANAAVLGAENALVQFVNATLLTK